MRRCPRRGISSALYVRARHDAYAYACFICSGATREELLLDAAVRSFLDHKMSLLWFSEVPTMLSMCRAWLD